MPHPLQHFTFAAAAVLLAACGGSTTTTPPADSGGSDGAGSDAGSDTSVVDTSVVDTGPKPDAPSDGASTCFGDAGVLPSVPFKVCVNDTDCTTAHHQTDCCGSFTVVGVAKSQESDFLGCEKSWQDGLPKCGCPAGPMKTEDGKTVTDPTAVVVKCADRTGSTGICTTSMP
jgi:hypothetical protein